MPEQRTEMGNSQGRIKNDTSLQKKVKLRNTTVSFNILKNITKDKDNTKLSRMSGYQVSHLFLLGT